MIRLVFLLRRKSELSLDDFQRYWREDHAALVSGFQKTLAIQRYVQVHRIEDTRNEALAEARGGMEPAYDGVAELWWDNVDALAQATATAEGQTAATALVEDEARFIDLPRSPLWLSYEYPQVNPTPENIVASPNSSLLKLYFPLRLKRELDWDEGQLYWRTQHGPLIRAHAQAQGILRYMQVHRFKTPFEDALRAARGTEVEPYDGHAEVWLDGAVQRRGTDVREAGRLAIEDEAKFIDFKRSAMWFGKEHVILDRRR